VLRDPFGNEFCVLQPEFPRSCSPAAALARLALLLSLWRAC
jgi:hypothetical protein